LLVILEVIKIISDALLRLSKIFSFLLLPKLIKGLYKIIFKIIINIKNCNATKGDTDINEANIAEYYWPHLHNTFLAFQYNNLGLVTPSTHEHVDFQRARNTINLFGLDKVAPRAGTIAYEDASDLRFENRIKAWHYAEKWEFNYRQAEDGVRTLFRELLPSVLDSGFFSIWMTVFNNHLEVKELIINSFSGTARNCFDQHYHPINRH
jgi:hypothetical protein